MQLLSDFQDVYSPHKIDFGVVDMFFHITLKLDTGMTKQSITKVPIHYRDKVEQILDDLEHNGIIERVGLGLPEILNLVQFS